jgi:ribosomal RNA-processing protein 17
MLAKQAATNAAEVEKAYGGAAGALASLFQQGLYLHTSSYPLITDDASDEEHPNLPSSSRRQQKKFQGQAAPEEEEYEDEEELATVTIVEDFDPDTIIHGPPRIHLPHEVDHDEEMTHPHPRSSTGGKSRSAVHPTIPPMVDEHSTARGTVNFPAKSALLSRLKPKLKVSKKVKYQTKSDRGLERKKQRARRTEKAERAGGKASRKNLNSRRGFKKR